MKKTMKKKLYTSLPISGIHIEEVLKRCERIQNHFVKRGYDVVTPFDLSPEKDHPYEYHMGKDIEGLLKCDVAYFDKGWETSRGCRLERKAAEIYGLEIICYDLSEEPDVKSRYLCKSDGTEPMSCSICGNLIKSNEHFGHEGDGKLSCGKCRNKLNTGVKNTELLHGLYAWAAIVLTVLMFIVLLAISVYCDYQNT